MPGLYSNFADVLSLIVGLNAETVFYPSAESVTLSARRVLLRLQCTHELFGDPVLKYRFCFCKLGVDLTFGLSTKLLKS